MGIANLIKEGILEEDWDKIREAYSELTGIDLSTQKIKIEPLIEDEEDEEPSHIHTIKGKNYVPKPNIAVDEATGEVKNYGIRQKIDVKKIQAVGNLWNPEEFGDVEKDAKSGITYKKPTKRTRQPAKFVDIKCDMCNRKFKVSPVFIRDKKYTCDNCIKGKTRSE